MSAMARKRPTAVSEPHAAMCQEQTYAVQHQPRYSITSSARCWRSNGTSKAERLRGLEVDHQLELDRLLDRKVCWFGTSQNLVHEIGRTAPHVGPMRPIRDKTSCFDQFSNTMHGGQSGSQRETIDAAAVSEQQRNGWDVEGVCAAAECFERAVDVISLPDLKCLDFERDGSSCAPNLTNISIGKRIADICQDCQPAQSGNELPEKFDSFTSSFRLQAGQAGDIATWPRKAGDDAAADRISCRCKHDGDHRGSAFCRKGGRSIVGENYIELGDAPVRLPDAATDRYLLPPSDIELSDCDPRSSPVPGGHAKKLRSVDLVSRGYRSPAIQLSPALPVAAHGPPAAKPLPTPKKTEKFPAPHVRPQA